MTISDAFRGLPPLTITAEFVTAALIVFMPFWWFPVLRAVFALLAGF